MCVLYVVLVGWWHIYSSVVGGRGGGGGIWGIAAGKSVGPEFNWRSYRVCIHILYKVILS